MRNRLPPRDSTPRYGIARVVSKLGICSRSQAAKLVVEGRIALNGRVVRDPETPVGPDDRLTLDGAVIEARERLYIALNKPRGLVTTASDERGRATVYSLIEAAKLPWLAPVGRLDKASEGLLLMTNDGAWAARIASPESSIAKTYHVQIDRLPDDALLDALVHGADDRGERLATKSVRELRRGGTNAWLEVVLDEGKNREIRRLLAAHGVGVLRLVRVAIGDVGLGTLGKGAYRELSADEVTSLSL
jgi:23S rRNA pseudouridine2605 synthase